MFVLAYLNGLYLCLSLGIYILAVKRLQGEVSMGIIHSIKNGGDSQECSLGNQLNAAVAYGSSSSHLRVPSMENF